MIGNFPAGLLPVGFFPVGNAPLGSFGCGCFSPYAGALFGRAPVSRRGLLCAAAGFAAVSALGGVGDARAQGADYSRLTPLRAPGGADDLRAELILQNGPVHSMVPGAPVARAIAIANGRILAVGSVEQVAAFRGPRTRMVDLDGRAVTPGFIDAHGHISQVAMMLALADLQPPPAGGVRSIADIGAALRRFREQTQGGHQGWLIGSGYDDSLLAEQRHPTRDDLDAISREQPICITHVSGHLAVLNSKALEIAGITAATEDPAGGVILRRPGTREPDGQLQEHALLLLARVMPPLSADQQIGLLGQALQRFAGWGFTTVQDGLSQPADWANMSAAARRAPLPIDVNAYPMFLHADALEQSGLPVNGGFDRGLRIAGLKISLDGSPQGKTAWLSQPYVQPPPGQKAGYAGYAQLQDREVERLIDLCFRRRWPAIVHCNGDAAGDQLIRAVEKATRRHGRQDRRTVMIHAQTVREDQLDAMQRLDIMPSFFIGHVYYWGDYHRDSVLGPQRGARISPVASALRRNMAYTLHADAPVVPGDAGTMLWAATQRRTRSDKVLGEAQRVNAMAALAGLTRHAAWQSHEEAEKGTLGPGKLADIAVLDTDPLTAAPEKLRELPVAATLKRGVLVHGAL